MSLLSLDAIDFHLSEGGHARSLIEALSIDFAPGQFACITGPSGCGKTTILSLLASVCIPHGGQVVHDGLAVSALDEDARRRWRRDEVGMVFQTCRLIDVLTVTEHMALVAKLRGQPHAAAAGIELAHDLGLAELMHERPGQLSGGEKQRAALAQAMAHRPRILLADEPTAALDHANSALVARRLRRYAHESGAIVVAVSHDQIMMDAADDVVELSKPSGACGSSASILHHLHTDD